MLRWEGRILDNKSIMVVKAALPFLDIPVGDVVDMEGLLHAIRNFCQEREKRFVDMLLNLFMMKRVFSMMSMMNAAQESGTQGSVDSMLELLKGQMPKEQQEMFDMMTMMMSAMQASDNGECCDEEVSETDGESIPEIWQNIAQNNEKEIFHDRSK